MKLIHSLLSLMSGVKEGVLSGLGRNEPQVKSLECPIFGTDKPKL